MVPVVFGGGGIRFYGKRDELPDGSCVTTKWLTAMYLPIIPLASFRVWRVDPNYFPFFSTGHDQPISILPQQPSEKRPVPVVPIAERIILPIGEYVVEKVPLNWRQIVIIYLSSFGILALGFLIPALLMWILLD